MVAWSKPHLGRCPSRVCAYRRRERRILDEVAHLDFIGRAKASAPRTAQAALVVVDLSVRNERDLVGRQPADVAAAVDLWVMREGQTFSFYPAEADGTGVDRETQALH